MRFCIPLAFNPAAQWMTLACAAERAGFGAMVLSDHLFYPARLASKYPYTTDGRPRWDADAPWPDPLIAAAAIASATRDIALITSVLVLPLRHPVVAAKQIATAAAFANGRLVVGVGCGWMREEFDALGVPFARRGSRLEETVSVMRELWAGGMVEHRGEHHRFDALQMSPAPARPIPLWGGGTSRRALERAATLLDGWVSEIQTLAEVREILPTLREMRSRSKRAGLSFGTCVAVRDAYAPEHYQELESLGVNYVVTVPWMFYGGDYDSSLEEKCDGIRRFASETVAPLTRRRSGS
jgi:probable F420-dependent oxidoreductase